MHFGLKPLGTESVFQPRNATCTQSEIFGAKLRLCSCFDTKLQLAQTLAQTEGCKLVPILSTATANTFGLVVLQGCP
jgi:hypothetical protein